MEENKTFILNIPICYLDCRICDCYKENLRTLVGVILNNWMVSFDSHCRFAFSMLA
ncbi:hypothetical protein HMPREF0454_02410 [Hafnia alvei ATCC 51873]|uniref:Uncharacterized protein n=1 Tax=Hafnia alvei ATCC 51873 TaxID=1002364 RepID=G9Y7F0_HAFAL|nr:hypothetical protein HMPREF0454_02410 [Hafnia alvei ATCC 51873]